MAELQDSDKREKIKEKNIENFFKSGNEILYIYLLNVSFP